MTLLSQGTDPKRAKPIPMPGVQPRIYEGFVKDSTGGEIPFYCYFVVLEMPKVPGVNLADIMKSAIAKMPGSPQMTEVQATSPEGKESKWQMVHGPEKDEFYYKKDGKDTLQPMDAIDEMYHHEEAGVFVIIAWRLPASIEKNIGDVGLTDLAKAVAGGVSVKPQ